MPKIKKAQTPDLARQVIHQEVLALQKLELGLGNPLWQFAQLLIDCSGLIWITATGTSAPVGMRFAHFLTCSSVRTMFLSPTDGMHAHTNIMQPGKVLLSCRINSRKINPGMK